MASATTATAQQNRCALEVGGAIAPLSKTLYNRQQLIPALA
jgi:hypothetical protein